MKETICACLLCVACRSGASREGASDWITGRDALQSMMTVANQWSPDANAIRLFSGTCQKPPRDGVCNDWRAVVVSVSEKKTAGFYSRGGAVTQDQESGLPQDKQTAIDLSRIKADSDVAFRLSEEHGGRSLLEKNPNTEIRYAMMWDNNAKHLIWLVLYDIKGTDISSAKLHIAANAETGDFLQ